MVEAARLEDVRAMHMDLCIHMHVMVEAARLEDVRVRELTHSLTQSPTC